MAVCGYTKCLLPGPTLSVFRQMGSGSGSIPRSRVSVEVTVDHQTSQFHVLTTSEVCNDKEVTMVKRKTYTHDMTTKARINVTLSSRLLALIAVISLVFGSDGGVAPPSA